MLTEFLRDTVNPLIQEVVPGAKLISGITSLASSIGNNVYNRHLQERMFNREDSSFVRTVADMQRAGISPATLTAGVTGQTRPVGLTDVPSDQFDGMDYLAPEERRNLNAQSTSFDIQNEVDIKTRLLREMAEIDRLYAQTSNEKTKNSLDAERNRLQAQVDSINKSKVIRDNNTQLINSLDNYFYDYFTSNESDNRTFKNSNGQEVSISAKSSVPFVDLSADGSFNWNNEKSNALTSNFTHFDSNYKIIKSRLSDVQSKVNQGYKILGFKVQSGGSIGNNHDNFYVIELEDPKGKKSNYTLTRVF